MGNDNGCYFMERFVVFEKLLKKNTDVKRIVLGYEEQAKGVTVIHSNLLLRVYVEKRSPCLRIGALEANEKNDRFA